MWCSSSDAEKVGSVAVSICHKGRHKMGAINFRKASWKDTGVEKLFIGLCIGEVNTPGEKGSSSTFKSWDISEARLRKNGMISSQTQLETHRIILKRKYTMWINLVGTSGHG